VILELAVAPPAVGNGAKREIRREKEERCSPSTEPAAGASSARCDVDDSAIKAFSRIRSGGRRTSQDRRWTEEE
jgi:hypothetical protein